MNKYFLIGIVAILIIAGGWWYFNQSSIPTTSEVTQNIGTQPVQQAQTNIQTQPTTQSLDSQTFSDSRVAYTFKYPAKYRADVFDYGASSNEVCIVGATVKNPQGCWMQFRTGVTSRQFSAQAQINDAVSVNVVYEQEAAREGQSIPAHRRHAIDMMVGNVAAKGIISTARDGKQNLISVVLDRAGLTYVFSSGAVLNSPEHKEFMDIMASISFR